VDEGDIEELHAFLEKSEIELVEDEPTIQQAEERAVDRKKMGPIVFADAAARRRRPGSCTGAGADSAAPSACQTFQ